MPGNENKPIPKWPDSLPPPAEVNFLTPEHALYRENLVATEDIKSLIHDLFFFPEDKYFLYYEYDSNEIPDGFSTEKLERHGIALHKYENFYYHRPWDKEHPEEYSYVRLNASDIKLPWQQELVDAGPMYGRVLVELMEWQKKEIELSIIKGVSDKNDDPLLLQPNIFGFGLDLKKIWPWIKRITSKKA